MTSDSLFDPAPTFPRCPDCGHPFDRHRENGHTQNSKPGDPVPCIGFVGRRATTPPGSPNLVTADLEFCGCTTILPDVFV